jgi:hypothetical protein
MKHRQFINNQNEMSAYRAQKATESISTVAVGGRQEEWSSSVVVSIFSICTLYQCNQRKEYMPAGAAHARHRYSILLSLSIR